MIYIYILEILEHYASKEKKISQKEIRQYLEKEYRVTICRKTLSKYINILKDENYIAGSRGIYKINKFTDNELRLLMDGILFSKHISQTQALELIGKIKSLAYEKLRKTKHIYYVKEMQYTENEKLYEVLDTLDDAIEHNKKVKITKYTYNNKGNLIEGEKRIISPYFIVSSKSMYYLICYSGRNGQVENRRIDRISNVEVLEESRVDLQDLECNQNSAFDLGTYMQEHIYMFSGESGRIKLKIAKKTIGDVVDWYGKEFTILGEDSDTITISLKANVNAVYYWAIQYGKNVEVLEPLVLRSKIRRGLKEMLVKYGEEEEG